MARYESELTGFLRTLRRDHPDIEQQQKEGRALWWDRAPDPDEQRRWQESRVKQTGYVYYLNEPVRPIPGS
jgi:Protein of unknown function (DUF3460)